MSPDIVQPSDFKASTSLSAIPTSVRVNVALEVVNSAPNLLAPSLTSTV